jgi:GntR family uxuAB operon transcriptional repressor
MTNTSTKNTAQEPRLYRLVAGRLQDLIREKKIGPGERLPSERDLATKLSVSRASLREALISLELSGHVEVRGGSGVYVSEKPAAPAAVPEIGPGPFEVLSARRLIEPEIAGVAARVANDSAIDAILRAATEMERLHDVELNHEMADRAFHLSIARATGNSAMVGLIEYLWDQRGRLWHRMEEHFQTEELRKNTLTDHRRVLQAIVAHEPASARRAMRDHLERVARVFSRGSPTFDRSRVPVTRNARRG